MPRSTLRLAAGALLACAMTAPAMAGNNDGKIQIKALATAVLPEGDISDVKTDLIGLPSDADTRATDSIVPTIAAEYFFAPSISVETICCVTPHDVRGTGALSGADLIDNAIILPATVTAKYHFNAAGAFKPYVGAGVTHFFIFGEDVGSDAAALGATDVDLSNEFGVVLQAGFDMRLNDKGLGLSIDAKRYFVGTTATFEAGNTTVLRTEHDLNPWVLSAGLSYRF